MLGIFFMFTSCDNAAQKVVKAEENVVDAEKDLQMAEEEYLADVEQYKLLSAEKIAANDRSIAEFNARIEQEKKKFGQITRLKSNHWKLKTVT